MGHFEWQRGYGGFSYSRNQRNDVIQYIMSQKIHHQEKSFKVEYMKMLNDFEMDFQYQCLFEFYE